MSAAVRIGVLGAAKIVPNALTKPARKVDDVEVVAVAARDRARAQAFASKHQISRVHGSYEDLVADPEINAVYVPLPNSLHGVWTLAALDAGKHVLCEKPFTANADEAERVAKAADASGLVVMEAFHWRYHPVAARMIEIIRSGELGELRHVEATFAFPLFKRSDIRWQPDLAGGALMDAGCYAIHMTRTMAGSEPEVVAATSKLRAPGIDRMTAVEMAFAGGVTGRAVCSMWSSNVLRLAAGAEGDRGSMRVLNPLAPQFFHRISVRTPSGTRHERVGIKESTYEHQLRAFVGAVRDGAPTLTPPAESVANMRVIDAAYRAAGLAPRLGATDL